MKFVFSTSKSKLRVEVQGVGLQNFQGVKDFVWLPLAQLTLIFGPNSAGKSSIADALGFLERPPSAQMSQILQGSSFA